MQEVLHETGGWCWVRNGWKMDFNTVSSCACVSRRCRRRRRRRGRLRCRRHLLVVFRCYRRPSSSDVTDVFLSVLFITPMTYMRDGLGWAGLGRTGLCWACRSWAGLARAGLEHTKVYRKPDVVMVGICGGFRRDSCRFWGFMRIGCDRHLGICGIAGGFKRVNSPLL